ncbi:MAG: hypothetical protein ACKOTZ_04600 [Chloroflexota bacterium]
MDWTYPAGASDGGIFEIGKRLADALGRAPDVTRFTYDAREMLRATREIEQASRGGRLIAGFQTADKLAKESERYAALHASGTRITVFGVGARPADPTIDGVEYRALAPNPRAIANQWVLATDDPEQLAFVSYEIGDPASFGVGGAGAAGKRFVGFVSDDPGVVRLLIDALDAVARPAPPAPPVATVPASPAARDLAASLDGTAAPDHAAGPGAVVVAIGRGDDRRAFLVGAAIARRDGRTLLLVDRTAEGFSNPYTDLRGDDADRPSPDRLVALGSARREGRNALALFLEAAAAAGIEAAGWFPVRAGAEGLAEAARRFGGALCVVPSEVARPGLAERLRGMTVEKIGTLTAQPVIVAG